ncbi:zona pellucida glycoprotein 3d tandem duplicate 1 [Puntigrus tetrazona]|uniref:zona pellucida glycoprotein 3d tandem duplicate 1 n=1 Tax=Puntigrus tetrazona TaxID=1606681 RepID=UPI001C8AFEED|nr:zona pellucida glycoprotein 3d tandem duplicate 1 [Puntigrus tetrazona]
MERTCLYFCCSLYFLGVLHITASHAYGTGGHPEYSDVVSAEQKGRDMRPGAVRPRAGDSEFMKDLAVMRPYHVFPMFRHVPSPLAGMELFRPVPGKRPLPSLLTSLLIPQTKPQHILASPVRNARGVEVWCGYSKVSVRVNKSLLGFRSSPPSFRLGTCPVSRSDEIFLYFHYDLSDCDSSLTMMKGQIIYSNMLHYTPAEPPGTVIRAVPLTLNIQCLYNRFHYSYKMGFLPVVREHVLHKIFERRAKFSLDVCNERWERLEGNGSFVLGEPMYFEASAAYLSENERIFVDSCYVTASTDPKSVPQHHVIYNYGCMGDSRRQGSLSRFLQRHSNIIRFSVDAFLFPQVTGTHFYLHCTVSVHSASTSATAKSCTYNNVERRWDELYTNASVCACCDFTCEIESFPFWPRVAQSIISKPWILDKSEQSLMQTKKVSVKDQEDTEEVKFKGAEGVDKEEEDCYTVEIVTDTKERTEATEKHEKMSSIDLDEDVEVIFGTVETTAKELKEDRSGKVMLVREQKNRVVKIGEDDGRSKSTGRTDIVKRPGVELMEELSEDVNDNRASSKSGAKEMMHIPREELSEDEMQPEDFKMNVQVESTIAPSQIEMDEERFLNAKHEPVEWNQDKH